MLAIRSIIVVLFCFVGKLLKFLLTFERKKGWISTVFYLKMLKSHSTRFNARAIIDSETEIFSEERIHEYFAQCRYHSSLFVRTLEINK